MRDEASTLPETLARVEDDTHRHVVSSKVATGLRGITRSLVTARRLVDGAVGHGLVGAVVGGAIVERHGLIGGAGGAGGLDGVAEGDVDVGCACETKVRNGM